MVIIKGEKIDNILVNNGLALIMAFKYLDIRHLASTDTLILAPKMLRQACFCACVLAATSDRQSLWAKSCLLIFFPPTHNQVQRPSHERQSVTFAWNPLAAAQLPWGPSPSLRHEAARLILNPQWLDFLLNKKRRSHMAQEGSKRPKAPISSKAKLTPSGGAEALLLNKNMIISFLSIFI